VGFIYDFNKLYIPQNGAQYYYKVEVNEVIICRKPVSRGAKLELSFLADACKFALRIFEYDFQDF